MDKKLYTIIVHSENIAGLLNQVTAVFTRRQINIESLNVSASSIQSGGSGHTRYHRDPHPYRDAKGGSMTRPYGVRPTCVPYL